MKKTLLLFFGVAAALVACNKQPLPAPLPQEEGTLELTIHTLSEDGTKALTAYTTEQTYEKQVNSVQLFIFGSDGKINVYKNLGTSLSASSISTSVGSKTVYAVVNGPDLSSVATLSALQAKAVDLSTNSTTASSGFLMAGKNTVTISAGSSATCNITVSRLAARVALAEVTNKLPASYGALTIKSVFLANVVGNQNIAGTASPSKWYNQEGRKDESPLVQTHIIDGSTYTASCPTLTYKSLSQAISNGGTYTPATPHLFYCYGNTSTVEPNGFSASFSAQRTVLVVAATVASEGSKVYYYPVVLNKNSLKANSAYTVYLTISSLGSTDPNDPVDKEGLTATITTATWTGSDIYDDNI